jgi:hypothetical protein
MDKTKIYVVTSQGVSLGMLISAPVVSFLKKEDAEFYIWQKKQKTKIDGFTFSYRSYSIEDIDISVIEKSGKEYEKFCKEKLTEIDTEIEKRRKCKDTDLEKINKLEEEKVYFSSK